MTEHRTGELEYRLLEFTHSEKWREERLEQKWTEPQGPVQKWQKKSQILDILEGQEKQSGAERAFEEIMSENLPDLAKDTDRLAQKSEPTWGKPHQNTLWLNFWTVKTKENSWDHSERNNVSPTEKKKKIQMTANFTPETAEVRRKWHIFQYERKALSAANSVSRDTFLQKRWRHTDISGEGTLKEFVTSRPTLKGIEM